jgi:hypothetical protein
MADSPWLRVLSSSCYDLPSLLCSGAKLSFRQLNRCREAVLIIVDVSAQYIALSIQVQPTNGHQMVSCQKIGYSRVLPACGPLR